MNDSSTDKAAENQFEQERISLEKQRLALDLRMLEHKERELAIAESAAGKSKWSNPLILSIVTLLGTIMGGATVSFISRDSSIVTEGKKHEYQMKQDSIKAAREMIAQVAKDDTASGCQRLKFYSDLNFIQVPEFRSALELYLKRCSSSEMPDPTLIRVSEIWESSWVGGGSNPAVQCSKRAKELRERNAVRDVQLTASSEVSRKNFWGKVEYKYYCSFDVYASSVSQIIQPHRR